MTSVLPSAYEPDRSWIPSPSRESSDYFSYERRLIDDAKNRTALRDELRRDRTLETLPSGFPQTIKCPATWRGSDFDDGSLRQDHYTLLLNDAQIREIEQACDNFNALRLPLDDISEQTFPLPTLSVQLKIFAQGLNSGIGFFKVRGLDPNRYSRIDNVVIYLGLSSYVGEQRGRQDELGNMLLHLTDVGSRDAPKGERQAPYSNVGQPFHTDGSDVIALYCLNEAECGGESKLASMSTVYNELANRRPDVVRLLASSAWVFDRFGQWPPYTIRPILFPLPDERVLLSFSRRPLVGNDSSPRSPGIPCLDAAQVEAINIVQFTAEQNCLSMKLAPGEMLFWNNRTLLHSRTGFTDSPTQQRHLLRLWIRDESTDKNYSLPEELRSVWAAAFEHGGRPQRWPVEPIRDRKYIINQQRSSGHG